MRWWEEFRTFALKGNMVDMAVGIIIGSAFGKVVSSLVNDVLLPPLGLLVGGVDFGDLALTLRPAVGDQPALLWRYGAFIQSLVDFFIVALAIFFLVKAVNALRREEDKPAAPATPPPPPPEVQLLTEIRDLLRERRT